MEPPAASTRMFQLEGYLHLGEQSGKSVNFKKNWFKLAVDDGKLRYYKNPKSKESGSIDLWECTSFTVIERDPKKLKPNQWPFKIITEAKNILFMAESEHDLSSWVEGLTAYKQHLAQILDAMSSMGRDLTPTQATQLAALRRRIDEGIELDDKLKAWCDDACLVRYLKARQEKGVWNVDKSFVLIKETLEWRKSYKPDEITYEDVKDLADQGRIYINGKDKSGRPVVLVKQRDKLTNFELYTRFVVWIMETAIKQMGEGVEQWVFIMDLRGFTRKAAPPRAQAQEALKIFYTHYPERLYKLFVIDAGKFFTLFWKMIGPFLEPETKQKVVMLSGPTGAGQKKTDALLEHIDAESLEKEYGGERESPYEGASTSAPEVGENDDDDDEEAGGEEDAESAADEGAKGQKSGDEGDDGQEESKGKEKKKGKKKAKEGDE